MNGRTARAVSRMVNQISQSVPEKDLNYRKTRKNIKAMLRKIKKGTDSVQKAIMHKDLSCFSRDPAYHSAII